MHHTFKREIGEVCTVLVATVVHEREVPLNARSRGHNRGNASCKYLQLRKSRAYMLRCASHVYDMMRGPADAQ
jgi:hypothetical protein